MSNFAALGAIKVKLTNNERKKEVRLIGTVIVVPVLPYNFSSAFE